MSKQVVLITGALAGIGRATAIAFAHEDAQIVVSGRRAEEGRKLAAELHSLGAEAEFIRADVRHEDDVRNGTLIAQSLAERDTRRPGRNVPYPACNRRALDY